MPEKPVQGQTRQKTKRPVLLGENGSRVSWLHNGNQVSIMMGGQIFYSHYLIILVYCHRIMKYTSIKEEITN
ncbi:hypothetical protein KJ591_00860 [Patescibacteria group bacterium]|nr:hypothetical protein [Patescibacteria group bacterium]